VIINSMPEGSRVARSWRSTLWRGWCSKCERWHGVVLWSTCCEEQVCYRAPGPKEVKENSQTLQMQQRGKLISLY